MDLSVIYPVHITFATRYILKRLETCLTNTTQGLPQAEHVIALSGKPRYIKQAKHIIADIQTRLQTNIEVVDYHTPSTPYSPGIARNFAVEHCTKGQLLFWDIDLLGSEQLFKGLPEQVKNISNQTNHFEMYPCLYLCQQYTKSLTNYSYQEIEQAWVDATQLKTNSIEHFAMATSTILCNKQHFLDIGAFDEDFIGHMGEDLELLNRLSIAYGKYPFEKDHAEDWPSKIPAELKGFRKHFALYGLDHLSDKRFTCHLNHSTRIGSLYKKSNTQNRGLLINKVQQQTSRMQQSKVAPDWPEYLQKPPSIKKGYFEVAFRKLRKLFKNPSLFLSDAF